MKTSRYWTEKKCIRLVQLMVIGVVVSGCQHMPDWQPEPPVETSVPEQPDLCLVDPPISPPEYNCDLEYWIGYWAESHSIPWPDRKTMIQEQDDSITGQLNKILLSQPVSTPYQDRLRAQNGLNKLLPQLSEEMAKILKAIVFHPSQQLLELESALTVLSRINSQQAKALEEQLLELEKQKDQLEQLIRIEANIVDTKRVNQQ